MTSGWPNDDPSFIQCHKHNTPDGKRTDRGKATSYHSHTLHAMTSRERWNASGALHSGLRAEAISQAAQGPGRPPRRLLTGRLLQLVIALSSNV